MEIPESQWGIVWEAIKHWMGQNNLSQHVFSLQIAGTRPPYMRDQIARGLRDGNEPITSDLLHQCVRIFGLLKARHVGSKVILSDEECIALLTEPLVKKNDQGKFQF